MIVFIPVIVYFSDQIRRAILRLFRAYFKTLTFSDDKSVSDDEESMDAPFAEYHEEKGVVFFPPVYAQRYAAVVDCLMDDRWAGDLQKVIDFGYHDTSFIKHLINVPGVTTILGVDIDIIPMQCTIDLINLEKCVNNKDLVIQLYQGNAADPDYRLIGCDAVVAIEMIEHMLPHDLERFIHTIFGFIKPNVAVVTTPNGDFNVLFKALESNGLRRLDHFFEWTQDQFHEWCSNIVKRYPQYTVSCKGIGPGPAGTEHLGCCSQLAMFINKDYHKQPDLNMNSLALVADKVKSDSEVSDYDFETINSSETAYSSSTLTYNKTSSTSCTTNTSYMTFETRSSDKMLQCDMDLEHSKCFLMFNEDLGLNVLIPRKKIRQTNYVIEDVTRRLNCSISHVKKFSKHSLNTIIKDKSCPQEHIKDLSKDIYELIEMIQLQECAPMRKDGIWCNINWGDDAPYWNQYYKLVKEFKYPFKLKTDDEHILDLISEELHKTLDKLSENPNIVDVKVTIPFAHIMALVQHISNDEDKVREVLEWNGYELTESSLVHSRRVKVHSDSEEDSDGVDYLNNHTLLLKPGVNGNYNAILHEVILKKIFKIRKLILEDKLKRQLQSILCRLTSLALRYTEVRNVLPNFMWLQCKLYDLLIIYERSEENRKRLYFETYTFSAKDNDTTVKESEDLAKYKNDSIPNEIFIKYNHLLLNSKDKIKKDTRISDSENIMLQSSETNVNSEFLFLQESDFSLQSKKLSLTKSAVGSENNFDSENCSDATSNLTNVSSLSINVESSENVLKDTNLDETAYSSTKANESGHDINMETNDPQLIDDSEDTNLKDTYKDPIKNICINLNGNISKIHYNILKTNDYDNLNKNTKIGEEFNVTTIAKPIPNQDLLQLFKLKEQNEYEDVKEKYCVDAMLASTEHSQFIYIVQENTEETVALRRTTATDTNCFETAPSDSTKVIDLKNNIFLSDTILLEDENEPTTSKGVRHTNFDVQCGSNTAINVSLCNLLPEQDSNFQSTKKSITPICSKLNSGTNTNDCLINDNNSERSIISAGIVIKNVISKTIFQESGIDSPTYVAEEESSAVTPIHQDDIRLTHMETKPDKNNPHDANISLHWLPLKSFENFQCFNPDFQSLRNLISSNANVIQDLDNSKRILIENQDSNQHKDLDATFITGFANKVVLKQYHIGNIEQISNNGQYSDSSIEICKLKLTRGSTQMHSYQQKQTSEDIVYQGIWRPQSQLGIKKLQYKTTNIKRGGPQKLLLKKNPSKQSDYSKNKILNRIVYDQRHKITSKRTFVNSEKVSSPNKRSYPIKKQNSNSNSLKQYFNETIEPSKFSNEDVSNKLKLNKRYHETCKYPISIDKENKVSKIAIRNDIHKQRNIKIKSRPSLFSSNPGTSTLPVESDKINKPTKLSQVVKKDLKSVRQSKIKLIKNKENIVMDENLYSSLDNKENIVMDPENNDNKRVYKYEDIQVSIASNNFCNQIDEKRITLRNIISNDITHSDQLKKIQVPDTILSVEPLQLRQTPSPAQFFLKQILNNVVDDALESNSESNSLGSGDSVKTSIQILPLKVSLTNDETELEQSLDPSTAGSELLISDTNLDTCAYVSDTTYTYESTSQASGVGTRRSSVTSFQSCQTDEIFSPPNWMFSDQDTDEDESLRSVGTSLVLNAQDSGNPIDNVAIPRAGAGDGRGIHSDYSHDSSDRGMSNSSDNTDLSSRTLSEVMSLSLTSTSDFNQSSVSFGSSLVQNVEDSENISMADENGSPTITDNFGEN